MNLVLEDNTAPSWVTQLFQGLDSRLHQIESQISNQNTWGQQIEEVLQNQNRTLQIQNLRISSIENQMSETNKFNSNVARVETNIQVLNYDVKIQSLVNYIAI